jgi:hypothetical protein
MTFTSAVFAQCVVMYLKLASEVYRMPNAATP